MRRFSHKRFSGGGAAVKISDIGEFGLIKRLAGGTIFNPNGVIKGIGDDAAVIMTGQDRVLLVSCDMLVDGVHFIYGKIPLFDLGHKAVAVNMSDIAAMGGVPRHVLVSLALPSRFTVEEAEELFNGMKSLLSRRSVNLIGGDTVRSDVFTIDVTILGEALIGSVIMRSGARPGDVVMVTGSLGDSAAGLEILLNDQLSGRVSADDREYLLAAHLTPEPRLDQSSLLVKLGFVTAMMDLSDGLAGDIKHICESSRVGAEIYLDRLPYSQCAARVARMAGKNVVHWALNGGEDYQLLFTVPSGKEEEVIEAFCGAGLGAVTAAGRITDPGCGVRLVGFEEDIKHLAKGFDHFSG
ncbi:MAG: hypothetical protein VR68_04875 [Peptococcaceae bacterium BRH_c4a]|nr:MAG: hypothetical protein VR68_04875 [Peptococcaceae bacterium BRH_c4a]